MTIFSHVRSVRLNLSSPVAWDDKGLYIRTFSSNWFLKSACISQIQANRQIDKVSGFVNLHSKKFAACNPFYKVASKIITHPSIILEAVEFGSGTFLITFKCLSPSTHDTVSSAQRMMQNSVSRVVSIAMSKVASHFVWCFTYISILTFIDYVLRVWKCVCSS
jgi:flagellar biosynthesis protein FlhB